MEQQSGQNQRGKIFSWDCPGEAVIAPLDAVGSDKRAPPGAGVLLPQLGVPGDEATCAAAPAAQQEIQNGEIQRHIGPLVPVGSGDSSGWSLFPGTGTRALLG